MIKIEKNNELNKIKKIKELNKMENTNKTNFDDNNIKEGNINSEKDNIKKNIEEELDSKIISQQQNASKILNECDSEYEPALLEELRSLGICIYTFDQIIEKGKNEGKDIVLDPAKPETICTICYTSGTTSFPKGAMVTHEALESTIKCMDHTSFEYFENDIYLSFLPYAHIMETLIFALIMTHGRTFALYSGNPGNLTEVAKILKPTIMTSVPRIFQRVYEGIQKELSKKSKLTQAIFNKAIEIKM